MPNLNQLSGATSTSGLTSLMNLGANSVPDPTAQYNSERAQQQTQHLFNTTYNEEPGTTSVGRLARFVGAAGIDISDMVGSAVIPGMDRGDIWNNARNMGLNGIADFAARNKSGVELTSGIITAVATGWAAEAYLAPMIATRLAGSTFLSSSKLWKWGEATLGNAKTLAKDSAFTAAMNGELATVLGTTGGRQLLRSRVAEGVGKAAVGEAAIAALTHTNEAMWSDDESTNLMMAAFGLGIGGSLGALSARYEMRRIANSDMVLGTRAQASDPSGFAGIREYEPDAAAYSVLGPKAQYKESANVTAMALQVNAEIPVNTGANRTQLLSQEQTEVRKQMEMSIQKIGVKGVEGAPNSKFNLGDSKNALANKHIVDSVVADPTLFMGIDEIGVGNIGENLAARQSYIDNLRQSDNIDDIRRAKILADREGLGLVSGSWMPDSRELRELGNYEPGKVEFKPTSKTQGHAEFRFDASDGKKITVNEGGNIRDFGNMKLVDQLKVYEGLNHVMDTMIRNRQIFTLPEKPTWLQIDMGLQMIEKGGKVDFTATGFQSPDQLAIHSLRLKATEAGKFYPKGLGFWDRAKLNLPLPSSLERIHDGTSDALAQVLNAAIKNPQMTVTEAKQLRTKLLQMSDVMEGVRTRDAEISGNMFAFNRNKDGQWQPIVTGYASYERITPELIGTKSQVIVEQAENKIYRAEQLQKGTYTGELTRQMLASPSYAQATKILHLATDQVTGMGGTLDRALGSAVTRTHRYRESLTMSEAFHLREGVDRANEAFTNKILQDVFQGAQNKLATIPNRGSKSLVDSWFSFAGGWDLEKGFFDIEDGMYAFRLDKESLRNQQRLGRPVANQEFLMNPNTGKPVVVDEVGLNFLLRFQEASNIMLKEKNAVRLSRGMNPLSHKPWYVPPPDTRGKIIGLTIDAKGDVVPGGAIVASTQEEFESLRTAKIQQLDTDGKGHRFYSRNQLESIGDIWDKADLDWIDPGFVGAPKKGQTGSIFGNQINAKAMEQSLQWVVDQIQSITNGAVRSMFDQQLAIARARSATESVINHSQQTRNIWDEWEATVLGRPLTSVKPGVGTQFVERGEAVLDSVSKIAYPAWQALGSTQTAQWINDLAQRMGISRVKGFRSFEELSKQLGPHTPYANVHEYVESTMRVSTPPTVKQIAPKLNQLSASLLLRWFELPNAAMNMLGIVANMPSILRSPNTPLIGTLAGKNGKKIGVIDSYKILSQGFTDMLSGAKHPDWDVMVKNGDTSQSIAELNKQLSLIDSKTSFEKVFMGDKNVKTSGKVPRSLKEGSDLIRNKGVDGLISLATDTTESMSRAWAHFIGLRLADANGIVGTEARHSFARSVANQAIANYNPLNKPELFQTSIGSMFGLFTSYMQQYNQRLFRWMEIGDYRSVGRQLAMQSTLFGVASTPGFNIMDYIADELMGDVAGNPDATLVDGIYAKYGPKVGSIIAHGGVQEIPKIFGLDSVALYSRADANFRSPTIDPTRLIAGLNVLSSVGTGIWETGAHVISSAADDGVDLNLRYISESIARNMPNRAMKGALTVLANEGQDVDASGNIVAESKGMFENSLRFMGLRSGNQQGQIEAYYSNASLRRRLAGRMETLRENTRANLRSGKPVDFMKTFNEYVEKGGSPTHFKTWIQEQMKSVGSTRGMKDFAESLRSPNSQLEAWRYDMMK